ncbi:MAG: hypothetical protein P4L43_15525 [Syntrophobacteraceae bacterium]|nr:hypothetical protein [Syntrophobacteraceae bacterium]
MKENTSKWPGRAIIISIVAALTLLWVNDVATAREPQSIDNSILSTGENSHFGGIYNDYARLIAGMADSQSALAPFQKKSAWVEYSRFIHRGWINLDKRLLAPERSWSEKELGTAASSEGAVFYPFSGPDFANIHAFFPKAGTYVLVAMEQLGDIPGFPAMTDGQFSTYLESMKKSLHDLLNVNYFLSAHMEAQIEQTRIRGVLPILLFMLARSNAQVLDVSYWKMGMDGEIRVLPALETTAREVPEIETTKPIMDDVEGIRIVFQGAGSEEDHPQTLYYFDVNLYNQAFEQNRHFLNFLRRLGPFTTFMKSASYVMFDPETSAARQFMLDHSRYLVQEDSGIPLKFFEPSDWSLRFYGHYRKPIPTFKEAYQKDLASIYKADKKIEPLPFGFGYYYNPGEANLMVAERKSTDQLRDEASSNNSHNSDNSDVEFFLDDN